MKLLDRITFDTESAHEAKTLLLIQRHILENQEKPEAMPDHVRTEVGTLGTMKVRKWEVEDFSKVPDEMKMIDATKVGKLVRAGISAISGIRIWTEETLKVNAK